jgi:hypothetical protein
VLFAVREINVLLIGKIRTGLKYFPLDKKMLKEKKAYISMA